MKKRKGVFKQGRKVVKSSKGQSSAHKDSAFEDFKNDFEAPLDDAMDYLRTEEVKDDVSTALHQGDEQTLTNDQVEEGTAKPGDEQTLTNDQVEESTDKLENVEPKEQTSTPTTPTTITTTFGDDETIAKVLLNMSQARAVSREKEKGVELKDVEESERPRRSSTVSVLTLKPLLKIDPKDKGKKRIKEDDESGTESDEVTIAEKKFKQLTADEELARKIQEDWEAEEEKKRLAEEEAINATLVQELDDVKVRIEAGRLLALRLQEEERDQFIIEERGKFLHDIIAA
ncbi:hypothetical protein Tco_0522760 [Tanacetum coccineum]